jgi:ribosomal protein L34E
MVTRQRLRVGATYAGKIVTVHVEDTHFRVTCDGTEVSLHPRNEQRPVTRWRAKIHDPKPERESSIS